MTQADFNGMFDLHRELMLDGDTRPIGRFEELIIYFQTYRLEWMR